MENKMAIGNKETEAVFSKEKIVDLVYRFAERKRISKEATANVIEEKRLQHKISLFQLADQWKSFEALTLT